MENNIIETKENIIPYDAPESAHIVTVTGWVSSKGRFYGSNEDLARYDGCTHRKCKECNALIPKWYTHCDFCRAERDVKRWESLPRKDWNCEDALYSESCDVYFLDIDQLSDYCLDHDIGVEQLRLVICEPISLSQIDSSYWHDELAEDQELPWEVEEAMEKLNEVIRAQPAVSWSPGKFVPTDESIKIT